MDITLRRWMAVAFAILMASSLVAMPVVASTPDRTTDADWQRASTPGGSTGSNPVLFGLPGGGPGGGGPPGGGPPGQGDGPPGHDRGDLGDPVDVPELSANTSIETMVDAVDRLEALDVDDEGAALVNETVDALNATALEYRSLRHADSRDAFSEMAVAQERLDALRAHVDENETAIVDDVSADLYRASNASARLAVANALYVVAVNEDEFRNPGQRQKAESALGNARDALARAEASLAGGGPGNGNAGDEPNSPADRAQALTHLENAWKHAGRALDTVEDNAEPSISVSQRRAFEDNGTVLVPLTVTIEDVRPYEYERATFAVDGAPDPGPINLSATPGAGGSATGTALIDVGSDAENATVTVRATPSHDAERTVETTHEIDVDEDAIVPDLPAPDEYTEVAVENESSGVRVDVAGEGLHESHIDVRDVTPETERPYRAGPMVRIENRTAFDEATVSIPVDEAALDREGNLSVVTWDPESDEPWTAVETEVDRDDGVLRADVEHFSFFSVFWIDNWEDETSATLNLTAEYDGNVTGPGNGSIEKIDVAFVIDESGSMSGSPISYARTATKRFVGALTDDEQAALVGYDSGASLYQPLTRDHDAVNASLNNLYARGGTHTEAGLRVGLDHIRSAGWDNRSPVMILLSDGNSNSGSHPRSVAEDAAEAGVEISTIGLGNNIDENELRDIAGITGGDFYHVQSPADLPDAFDRVAENTTGVDLPDTDGDTIPDLVEGMNLSMPTGGPGVVGEPLNLDSNARDTSGDGYLDNETVDVSYRVYEEDNATMLTASVTNAEHHPARVDTTGDGVTDRQQLEGWAINYTTDREETLDFLEALDDADDIDDLDDDLLSGDTVRANPLVTDSDGDGLSDADERRYGTDPKSADTTGDGISDAAALTGEYDPTLFDVRPPSIDVWNAYLRKPSFSFDGTYHTHYYAEDRAGLTESQVRKNGDVEKTYPHYGATAADVDSEIDLGALETIGDLFSGAKITVNAEDRNGNVETTLAYEQTNVWGEVSDELRSHGLSHSAVERRMGMLSGLTTGAGETYGFLLALYQEPMETLAAMTQIVDAIVNLDEVIASLPDAIEEQQERNNPHEPGTDLHDAYRQGWYTGYVGWFVVEAALPTGQISKAAKSSKRFQKLADDLSTSEIRRAAELAGRAKHTAAAPVRYSKSQLSRGLAASVGVSREVGSRLLRSVESSGQLLRRAKHASNLGDETLEALADGSGEVAEGYRQATLRAADGDAIGSYRQIDRAVQRIDELEGQPKLRAQRLVRSTDGDGIRLVDELDDDAFDAFVRIDHKQGFEGSPDFDLWRSNIARGSSELDSSRVNEYVKHVDEAADHPRITNPDGLVTDITGKQATGPQIRGQVGETRSAVRYADDGAEVTVEPGNGDYDLGVTRDGRTEYVDVKTPADDTSINRNYWLSQTESMNKKFENAGDVDREDAVLEVQTTKGASELDDAVATLDELLNTPGVEANFGEVRIRSTNADTRIITVDS